MDAAPPSPNPPEERTPTGQARRGLRRRLLFYPAAYLAFTLSFMIPGCAEKFLLFPSTHPIPSATRQRMIAFGDARLEIRTQRLTAGVSAEPDLFILEFLGNAERAEWGSHLPPLGKAAGLTVEVWRMNYPGFGESDGPVRLHRIPPAALAAFDELARVAGNRPIVLHGSSLGSAAALYVATQREVAGLILRNPPPLQNLIVYGHGWWNLWLPALVVAMGVPSELNSLINAPLVGKPAVFVCAEQDEVVPIHYQRKVVNAYAGPKETAVLPDAEHNTATTAEQDRALSALFDRVILRAGTASGAAGNGQGGSAPPALGAGRNGSAYGAAAGGRSQSALSSRSNGSRRSN
jgi:hypothetical protein